MFNTLPLFNRFKPISAALCFSALILTANAHAQMVPNECKSMLGDYAVVPFTQPLGLVDAVQRYGLGKKLGVPVFKVAYERGQLLQIGLLEGNRHPISIQKSVVDDDDDDENRGYLLTAPLVKCEYQLNRAEKVKVVQVDLTVLGDEELTELADYIPRGWGSAMIDFGPADGDGASLKKLSTVGKGKTLNAATLREVKYFLVHSISLTGVISYNIMVPLQKI